MKHYSLTDLTLFSAVADEGNLTRGAERIHLSASSASIRIAKLEEALGVTLLNRKVRGIELTAAGEIVNRYAKKTLWQLDEMQSALAPLSRREQGVVRIVANYGASIDFLPSDIARFMVENPHVRILLEQKSSEETVDAVASGRADIGVCVRKGPAKGVTFTPYREDRLVIVSPKGHPLAQVAKTRFDACFDYDFVALTRESAMQRFLYAHAAAAGHKIEPRIEVQSQQIVINLVKQGAGIGIVSRRSLTQESTAAVCVTEIEDEWAARELRLVMATGSAASHSPWGERLFEFLAKKES